MNDKSIDPKALREVYIILEKLNMLDKIPLEIRKYLENEQDISHEFTFNEKAPLIFQIENESTKVLLTYLVDKYINNQKA